MMLRTLNYFQRKVLVDYIKENYPEVYERFEKGEWEEAQEVLEEFLSAHPKIYRSLLKRDYESLKSKIKKLEISK